MNEIDLQEQERVIRTAKKVFLVIGIGAVLFLSFLVFWAKN